MIYIYRTKQSQELLCKHRHNDVIDLLWVFYLNIMVVPPHSLNGKSYEIMAKNGYMTHNKDIFNP